MRFVTTYLPNNPSLLKHWEAAQPLLPFIAEIAQKYAIPVPIVLGVGSHESGWGTLLSPPGPTGTGDFSPRKTRKEFRSEPLPPDGMGFGRGLMQIDYDAFEFARTGNWQDPHANILFGCSILRSCRIQLRDRTNLEGMNLLRGYVAAYNCGVGGVLRALKKGLNVDAHTAHRNYGKDVLSRAGWFEERVRVD